ncbi:MAG: type II toxin-antitoxin system YafQ family toxin [Candidatus Cloacimonas sp.]
MLKISHTSQFKRDYKKYRTNQDLKEALKEALAYLVSGKPLPSHFKDHPLKGDKSECRECHLSPNILLLYRIQDEVLILIRIGSHSNLFD